MAYKNKLFECQFNTSWALVFYTDTFMCIVSKVIGINTENKICLSKKEYISGY